MEMISVMAHTEPISIPEFVRRFKSEENCREYLFNMRWPNGFCCPECGHDEYYFLNDRKLYQCKNCRYQASVTAGTIMHRTRTPLFVWFWIIFMVSRDKRGHSALAISKIMDVSYYCAYSILHKIRKAMKDRDSNYSLSKFILVDDAYFGGLTKGKRGRGTSKTPVFIALSTDENNNPQFVKMKVLKDITKDEITKVANSIIEGGSIIRTDKLRSYFGLDENFVHDNELEDSYDISVEPFHWIHTIISNAKAFIQGTYHGISKKYLQSYLDEFCYRFNRRFFEKELFGRLVNACISSNFISIAELTK
jgi:transposase-like protein